MNFVEAYRVTRKLKENLRLNICLEFNWKISLKL